MTNNSNLYYASEKIDGIHFIVTASVNGIREILMNKKIGDVIPSKATRLKPSDPYLFNIFKQLREYFNRDRKKFDVPLSFKGTEFQTRVWNELKKIPYGKTISYKELALKLGNLKLIRAVGKANAKNPVPIVVPCHRVIGQNGNLTGYAGGLDIKEKLLILEGSRSMELFG